MEQRGHTPEDWFDDSFVAAWIAKHEPRAPDRQRHFAMVRAHLPFLRDQSFRYLNLGAGWGALDEVLLTSFPYAEATLVDGSSGMLARAHEVLAPFGDRITYAQANFAEPDWSRTVNGPYDAAVSTIALHNLFDATRIRVLYSEIYPLLAEGSLFMNLDSVRMSSSELGALARWARRDLDAGFVDGGAGRRMPGTLEEQVGWLREAGFTAADCFWRQHGLALFGGWRGRVRVPEVG